MDENSEMGTLLVEHLMEKLQGHQFELHVGVFTKETFEGQLKPVNIIEYEQS